MRNTKTKDTTGGIVVKSALTAASEITVSTAVGTCIGLLTLPMCRGRFGKLKAITYVIGGGLTGGVLGMKAGEMVGDYVDDMYEVIDDIKELVKPESEMDKSFGDETVEE